MMRITCSSTLQHTILFLCVVQVCGQSRDCVYCDAGGKRQETH